MKKDLGNDKISKLLLQLSVPAILSMLIAAIYNIVDRIFIGRTNPLGLTAIGITMPFQVIQMAFVLLIGVGGSTLMSIRYGEDDIESAEKILFNSLLYIIISELLLTVLCIVFMEPIFSLLGVSSSVEAYARDYILIILIGGVPGLTGYCLNNMVRSLGFSKQSMIIVFTSSVLNIVLDAIFIFVLGMGVKGAAVATVLSQTLVTVFVIYFFIKNKDVPVKLKFKNNSYNLNTIKEITSNGLPNFYMQIFGTVLGILLNRFIIHYGGDYHLASVTIITSIMMFFTMVIYGISQGAQPIIGYNFGAKKIDRSIYALKSALVVIIIVAVVALIVLELVPGLFVKLFTNEEELIRITNHNIRLYILGIPFIGIHSITTTYFQSIKKPKISSILYILKYGAVLIPLLFIVPKFMGVDGVYLSNALSDTIAGVVALILLLKDIKTMSREV
ncbi:putative efflux protein, MATE family [Peptostreptococcus russellii]|uniref:Multidrug export protein MepA n=2 Tax=Peptostreptococcus russellii TaxID=215200 RepID=A0A1H8ERM8_9FIRM|nr:MATE family efflux transporter [Peptostreptococcus russellii]SEN22050.1 putative efflux protein, MATE family [Peptostreptococcus russellii]